MKQIEILQRADRVTEALKQLRRTLIKFPDEPDLLQTLAKLQQNMGDSSEMLETLWKIHRQTKTSAEKNSSFRSLIKVYREDNNMQTLIELLEKQYKESPKSVSITLALAEIHKEQRETEQARTYLLAAARLKPEDVNIIHRIADLDQESNHTERAKNILLKAVAIDKTHKSITRLAQLYIDDHDMEKGMSLLKKLEQANDSVVVFQIANALVARQEFDDAFEYLEKSHTQSPSDWSILYQLVFLSHALERFDSLTTYAEKLMLLKDPTIIPGKKNTALTSSSAHSRSSGSPYYTSSNFGSQYSRSSNSYGLKNLKKAPKSYSQAVEYSSNLSKIITQLKPFSFGFNADRKSAFRLQLYKSRDLAKAKSLALSHILHVESTHYNKDTEEWIQKNAEVRGLDYNRQVIKAVLRKNDKKSVETLLSYEDNKLSSYLIFTQIGHTVFTDEQFKEGVQILRTEFPEMALKLRMNCFTMGSREELITLIKDIDASALSLGQKTNYLFSIINGNPEVKPVVVKYLESYQRLFLEQTNRSSINILYRINQILNHVIYKNKEFGKMVEQINYRSNLTIKPPRVLPPMSPYYLRADFKFRWPTLALESVPSSVWYLLYDSRNHPDIIMAKDKTISRLKLRFPADSVIKHLDKIESIPLRIHLLANVGKNAEALVLLEKSMKKSPKSIDLRMLAISHAYIKGKENRAKIIEQIEATSSIVVSRKKREMLDIMLLNQVYFIAQNPKELANFKPTEFQKSALRRFAKIGGQRSSEQIIVYQYLGMTKELTNQIAARQKRPQRKSHYRYQAPKPNKVMESYILNGKDKMAVYYAVQMLKKYYAANPANYSRRASEIFESANTLGIEEKIMNALVPNENDVINRWIDYYDMMLKSNLTKQLELARTHIMNQREVPLRKRIQVAMIIMPDNIDRAIELLESIPEKQQVHVAVAFHITYNQKTLKNESLLKHIKGFVKYIKLQKEKPPIVFEENTLDGNHFQVRMQKRADSQYLNILSTLLHTKQELGETPQYLSDVKRDKPATPLSIERDKLYDEMIQTLHHFPACTDIALRIMLLRKKDISDKEMLELISKTLSNYNDVTDLSSYMPVPKRRFTKEVSTSKYKDTPSAWHRALDYSITQPELAKQYLTPELLESWKKNHLTSYDNFEKVQLMAKYKDAELKSYVTSYYEKSDTNMLLFAVHYNPRVIEELSRQHLY